MYGKVVVILVLSIVALTNGHPRHGNVKKSAIVAFPPEVTIPVTNHFVEEDYWLSAVAANVSYKGTVTGLDKTEEGVKYNCSSSQIELTYNIPAATAQGLYNIDATYYFGVLGTQSVSGQDAFEASATDFQVKITGRIRESSFVCIIQDFKVEAVGVIELSESRDKLRVYDDLDDIKRGLVTDPDERNKLIDDFKSTVWPLIQRSLGAPLENVLNESLSKYTLDELITQIGAAC